MGFPSPIWGEIRAQKFWVQWEGIGKFQGIVMKFCTATTLDTRNMPAKFQLNHPQNRGVRAPNFGFHGTAWPIMPKVLATCYYWAHCIHSMQVPNIALVVTVGWLGGQTVWRISFIFGTPVRIGHRNIVLDGHPNRPKIGELWAKILGSMGRYRKTSSYRDENLYNENPGQKKHVCQISPQSSPK